MRSAFVRTWPMWLGLLGAGLLGYGAWQIATGPAPGPGDEELVAAIRTDDPQAPVAPPTSLAELADLLRRCELFVGTDNGARHLAAALDRPTVTLFGPTDPVGWNPADPRHVPVRTGEDCSPCDLTSCPVPGHPCLENLEPEAVLVAVRRVLASEGHRLAGEAAP